MKKKTRTIRVKALARVEGEGALHIKLVDDRVAEVRLEIFEPPRFFEAFLRGRSFAEAPDITARICGICPVAYQMSACHALENALGVEVGGSLRALRRLLYCGEWIESHMLHITLLHAPDFLGYEDGFEMARDHREAVQRGLELKKVGNEVMALLGGREVHPINVRVGGFYRAPRPKELAPLVERLKWARDAARDTVLWTASFPFPDHEMDYEFVSLRHPSEYPMNEGRVISNRGLDIEVAEFENHFVEEQVPHSSALHARLRERGEYLTGPLARYSLNYDRLTPLVQETAREAGLGPVCRNSFQSIVVRALEVLYACDEAIRIIEEYEPPDVSGVAIRPQAATGHGCTEAPRGILYHRYRLDAEGMIEDATIVPPTSQNQGTIESDLRRFVTAHIEDEEDVLRHQCEQVIRNYDPCISCATHFLKLHVSRE